MKKTRIFAALALSACMALGTMSVAACSPNSGNNGGGGNAGDIVDRSIMRVYEAYAESAKANDDDVMDYDEWYADLLANAKGEKGDKGDTGATGEKGDKGDTGDTGAQGEKGEDGAAGKDGNTWLVGTTAPTQDVGNDGDLYLDYSTWNVYHKVSGEWQLLGNIKGADGEGSQGGSQDDDSKDGGFKFTEATGKETEIPISGISAGVHIIEADLGNIKLTMGTLTAYTSNKNVLSHLYYSESRSTEGHNVYYSYIKIAEGDTVLHIPYIGQPENVVGTIFIKDWEMPTLKADTPVEMPVNVYGATGDDLIKIKLDSSISTGTYKIILDGDSAVTSAVKFFVGSKSVAITASNYNGGKTIAIEASDLDGEPYVYLIIAASNNAKGNHLTPMTVTLTPAA